ncbi:MAG: dephospho-CoA kinase [Rhodospirillaceae bacterium]|jgi:dephospho-CoA kinase|nr:dephospho-CoA kinase [Rhodospirillaceae bacterium]MBT3886162.1 dephospho-CoA kinase [Rhodospirillaceae bacterium]MBT4118233.1 dephospho-CoA kinase [Rhodospirillaceae bacterium]MBT4721322.1 dephospho-CoA kinase [Rhodospirillaceae bacterium]MBT4747803.1 dephospho-CoA kinase [Rhodospirillaceae bacterium]
MVIIGLTGSMAMGKTTVAGMFRYLRIPVYDADATVHAMLAKGGEAVEDVAGLFPGVVEDGAVNRARLGAEVFGKDDALAGLEAILHPMVRRQQSRFLKRAMGRRAALAVLDVPLLFETRGEDHCDLVAVVSASPFLQRARILSRPGMSAQKMRDILARQVPDGEKRRRADFIINTGLDRQQSLRQVRNIVTVAGTMTGTHWPPVKPR